jgi:hypothetical protein
VKTWINAYNKGIPIGNLNAGKQTEDVKKDGKNESE